MNRNKETMLLEGPVASSLVIFSLPVIAGALLQQLYNIADTFIVGKFIGPDALAAAGSVFALITFLNSVILGLCMGSGVLFSMFYGAGKTDEMKNSFFISFISVGAVALVLEIICLIFTEPVLVLLNTPQSIFRMTEEYIKYIFLAMFFTFLYNYLTCLLRALGNSAVPLIFLGTASVLNIILDIWFIVSLDMGIKGAAVATFIAQGFSAAGLFIYVAVAYRSYLPSAGHMYMNISVFRKIRDYSLLTCMQQSVMNFGILLIQGLVNSFGVITMSAFAAAVKIDAFAYMPVQEFGNAFSTFAAQNSGAGRYERLRSGFRTAFMLSSVFCIIVSVLIFIYAGSLMGIFISGNESEIISQGVTYLRIEGACYIGIGILFLLYGWFRGIGRPGVSLVLTVISLGTRVLVSYSLSGFLGPVIIWFSIPLGWILADIAGFIYMKRQKPKNTDCRLHDSV